MRTLCCNEEEHVLLQELEYGNIKVSLYSVFMSHTKVGFFFEFYGKDNILIDGAGIFSNEEVLSEEQIQKEIIGIFARLIFSFHTEMLYKEEIFNILDNALNIRENWDKKEQVSEVAKKLKYFEG